MQGNQARLIEALERVEEFLATNREVMGTVITSVAHENFSASRARVAQHMAAQDAYARGLRTGVGTKRAVRDELIREHMNRIAVVARTRLPNAGETAAFTVPPRTRKFLTFVAAGYGMAEAAKVHEQTFLAAGLPADFITKLVAATDALKASLNAKSQTNALRVEATAGLRKEGRVARNALRVLDALVRAAVRDDDTLLDRWTSISRVASAATSSRALDGAEGSTSGSESPDGSSGSDAAPASPAGITNPPTEAPAAA